LEQVSQKEAEDAEAEKRCRVLGPTLLYIFANPGDLVREHFKPSQNRMQEGALSLKDLGHKRAQGLRADEDQREEDGDLQNSKTSHIHLLELLRTQ
jgi:hypothetical protein